MDTPAFQPRGMEGVSCEKGQIRVTGLSLLTVCKGERLILTKLAQVVNPISGTTTSTPHCSHNDTLFRLHHERALATFTRVD